MTGSVCWEDSFVSRTLCIGSEAPPLLLIFIQKLIYCLLWWSNDHNFFRGQQSEKDSFKGRRRATLQVQFHHQFQLIQVCAGS